jgi:transcriptional regulator with XRE-family HTH domain
LPVPFLRQRSILRRRPAFVKYRKRNDLSQYEAAELAGISQALWHFYECGLREPSPAVMKRLVKLMKQKPAAINNLKIERRVA